MADRADWKAATRVRRHLAVAADAELRRRHPGQRFTPLRSAEPHPATDAHRAELALTDGRDIPETGPVDQRPGRRTPDLRRQARQLAEPDDPAEDPDYGDLGQAFPAWTGSGKGAILQPPKPQIRPSARVLERVADRDAGIEARE